MHHCSALTRVPPPLPPAVSFDERKPPSRGASLSKLGSGVPSQKQLSIPKPGVHHHMSGVSILGNAQEEPPIWKVGDASECYAAKLQLLRPCRLRRVPMFHS